VNTKDNSYETPIALSSFQNPARFILFNSFAVTRGNYYSAAGRRHVERDAHLKTLAVNGTKVLLSSQKTVCVKLFEGKYLVDAAELSE
jgi:hypothetical protein